MTTEASHHYFRSLREAGRDYVPAVGRGKRGTRWTDSQIGNLAIVMIGGPPVKSAETIEALGGMAYQNSFVTTKDGDLSRKVELGPLSNNDELNFGEQFAHIINWMSCENDEAAWLKAITGLQIEITIQPWIEASVFYEYTYDGDGYQFKIFYKEPIPSKIDPSSHSFYLLEKKVIRGPLVDGLGNILRNSRGLQLQHRRFHFHPMLNQAVPANETADAPGRVSAGSESKPYDDTRMETDTTHKVSCLDSADFSSCVCGPSSGVETSAHRTRSHDPHFAPHHHTLLQA